MNDKNLASRLCYLSLPLWDRVSLWLTYRRLKPVSIVVTNTTTYPASRRKIDRILSWIKGAGLKYEWDPLDTKQRCLLVSSDPTVLKSIVAMKSPLSADDHYKLGIFLGYPEKAVRAFSYSHPDETISPIENDSPVKNRPESLYAEYTVRRGSESEDVEVAKRWLKMIRKDVPRLAKWFEIEKGLMVKRR